MYKPNRALQARVGVKFLHEAFTRTRPYPGRLGWLGSTQKMNRTRKHYQIPIPRFLVYTATTI